MGNLLFIVGFMTTLFVGTGYSQDIRATTEDGRKVLLKSDGTWVFSEKSKLPKAKSGGPYQKPDESTSLLKIKGDKFLLWFDPQKWQQKKSESLNKTTFEHKDGDVYGMIIAERIGMPIEALKDMAIKNAQSAASDARVTFEEERMVNGKNILCMKMEGTIEGIKFVYYSYYYAGKAGVIQLITYTSQNLFPEYEQEMTRFLNGLVINE